MQRPIGIFLFLLVVGTLGYHFLEGASLFDSFYMTIITITTVGYKEVIELSPAGRVFTSILIILGVGTAMYALLVVAQRAVEVKWNEIFLRRGRKMQKDINKLKNHVIVCGAGKLAEKVVEKLKEEKAEFVVITQEEALLEYLRDQGLLTVKGDPTSEEALERAGIQRAKVLISLLEDDSHNLYLSLTARMLNPQLFIYSVVYDEKSESKFDRVGVNKTVNPLRTSAYRIAQAALKPNVLEFVDLVSGRSQIPLFVEEFTVKKNSPILNKTIKEADVRKKTNVIIISIKKKRKAPFFNPSPDIVIEEGDILIAMGSKEDLDVFKEKFIGEGK